MTGVWFYWSDAGNLPGCPAVCQALPGVWGRRGRSQDTALGEFSERQTHRTKKLEKTTEWGKTEWPRVESRGIKRGGPELAS